MYFLAAARFRFQSPLFLICSSFPVILRFPMNSTRRLQRWFVSKLGPSPVTTAAKPFFSLFSDTTRSVPPQKAEDSLLDVQVPAVDGDFLDSLYTVSCAGKFVHAKEGEQGPSRVSLFRGLRNEFRARASGLFSMQSLVYSDLK